MLRPKRKESTRGWKTAACPAMGHGRKIRWLSSNGGWTKAWRLRPQKAIRMGIDRPRVVAVSGFSSNVGKTTLVCELLRQLPGWEAIKLTRGHYRSCGRDPAGCCVSDLLREEPVVRSGREANYQAGKDTGHFWDAGASNVHWVIVKDDQVKRGINEALARVEADGVIVEGNSFLEYVNADLA